MADKPSSLIIDALAKAMTEPSGIPLHGSRAAPGLFAGNQGGRQAAQQCKDEGYLQVVTSESSGKAMREVCRITEKGLSFLLSQLNPRTVLGELLQAFEARRQQLDDIATSVRRAEQIFTDLRTTVTAAMTALADAPSPVIPPPHANGSETWKRAVLDYLARWDADHPTEDCPVPELFRRAQDEARDLTVGRFHDGLRELAGKKELYLHPWTGPLHDLPEPPYALLTGHEVAYYASLRA